MKILIVDDQPVARTLLRTVLAAGAHEVREVGSAADAIAVYGEFVPDVVLMDISMGELDGIEATRRIRASDPHARIIMITITDDPWSRAESFRAGASGYFLKDDLTGLPEALEGLRKT